MTFAIPAYDEIAAVLARLDPQIFNPRSDL